MQCHFVQVFPDIPQPGYSGYTAGMSTSNRMPRIGITVGDPAGIGPEIVARTVADPEILAICKPVVFGMTDPAAIARSGIEYGRISAAGGRRPSTPYVKPFSRSGTAG